MAKVFYESLSLNGPVDINILCSKRPVEPAGWVNVHLLRHDLAFDLAAQLNALSVPNFSFNLSIFLDDRQAIFKAPAIHVRHATHSQLDPLVPRMLAPSGPLESIRRNSSAHCRTNRQVPGAGECGRPRSRHAASTLSQLYSLFVRGANGK